MLERFAGFGSGGSGGFNSRLVIVHFNRLVEKPRLKGLIYRSPGTHRYFVTPYGWKVARLFSRLEARVFRPAVAMFTGNDAVLPFPLRCALDRVDAQLDELIYDAFPQVKAA